MSQIMAGVEQLLPEAILVPPISALGLGRLVGKAALDERHHEEASRVVSAGAMVEAMDSTGSATDVPARR